MRKYSWGIVWVVCAIAGVGLAKRTDSDWHYWNEFVLEYEATERITAELKAEQVFIDDGSDFALYNFTVGAHYHFSDFFVLGAEYMYEKEDAGLDWPDENRFSIIPTIKWRLSESKWSLRTKLDYRVFDDESFWRIRERLKIKVPVEIAGFEFSPFISDEIYYNFKMERLSQNRFRVGAGKDFGAHFELILYYMNLATNIPGDEDCWFTNIFGTEVVFKF